MAQREAAGGGAEARRGRAEDAVREAEGGAGGGGQGAHSKSLAPARSCTVSSPSSPVVTSTSLS